MPQKASQPYLLLGDLQWQIPTGIGQLNFSNKYRIEFSDSTAIEFDTRYGRIESCYLRSIAKSRQFDLPRSYTNTDHARVCDRSSNCYRFHSQKHSNCRTRCSLCDHQREINRGRRSDDKSISPQLLLLLQGEILRKRLYPQNKTP